MPTYGMINPDAEKSVRRALFFAADNGVSWHEDVSFDREQIAKSREKSMSAVAEMDIDGVLWCDSDMVVERQTFYSLIVQQKDIIAALAFERRPPHYPVAWYEGDPLVVVNEFDAGVIPVDGVGFGCVYTSKKALDAVGTFDHPRGVDEDRAFCIAALAMGFQPYVDTHNRVEHIAGPRTVGIMDRLMQASLSMNSLPPERNP
jgi:hypothetical protein